MRNVLAVALSPILVALHLVTATVLAIAGRRVTARKVASGALLFTAFLIVLPLALVLNPKILESYSR